MVYLPIVLRNYAPTTASASSSTRAIENAVSPAGVIDHRCKDAYELDDTWQQAKSIEPGIAQVHSFDSDSTYYAADKDFVWFEIQPNRTITFTATPVDGTATLLELYDASGVALGQTSSTRLVWETLTAGRYFLGVSPGTNAFGCAPDAGYSLLAEIEPQWTVYLPVALHSFAP